MKAPVSAIVVGFNEGHLLKACLASAGFCDEKLYVDLGSNDDSLEIARELGWETLVHERVPIGEFIVSEMKRSTRHPWILFLDPDERISPQLAEAVCELFEKRIPTKIGVLSAPWRFHFKGKRLIGTPWGGAKFRPFIAHRDRFTLTSEVHRGRQLLDGFAAHSFGRRNSQEYIDHFWSNSWADLMSKHRRYLRLEGESQFNSGRRTTPYRVISTIPRLVVRSLRDKQPFRDGVRGFGLTVFWIAYQTAAQVELLRYQEKMALNTRAT